MKITKVETIVVTMPMIIERSVMHRDAAVALDPGPALIAKLRTQ